MLEGPVNESDRDILHQGARENKCRKSTEWIYELLPGRNLDFLRGDEYRRSLPGHTGFGAVGWIGDDEGMLEEGVVDESSALLWTLVRRRAGCGRVRAEALINAVEGRIEFFEAHSHGEETQEEVLYFAATLASAMTLSLVSNENV